MPVTIRGKQEPPSAQKDGVSTPPPADTVDPKTETKTNKFSGGGKRGGDSGRSSTDKTSKSTEASKSAGTSTPPTTARQRARERRRGRVEASPEPDSNSPDAGAASAGRIKNLAGFWSTQKDDVQVVGKKRLEVADRTEKADDADTDSSDSDSDLDSLKRAQEAPPSSEMIEIEKGRAKSIANMWQNRNDDVLPAKKKPFKLDIETEEPTVFENEPVVLEGVVRSDDRSPRDEIVVRRPGRIKDLAVNFATNSQLKQDSSDDEDGPAERRSSVTTKKKTTEEVIECGKIRNVRERWNKRQQKKSTAGASDSDSEGDESSATDDTPQRSSRTKDQVIEQGKMRNLRDRWKQRQDGSSNKDEARQARRSTAPVLLHSIVTATEYGVFENEPVVRDDVVRADDEQVDLISFERTQKLRRMWTMLDKEGMKDKEPVEQVVKTTKKKVEKQDPEPEVVKPQTSKPQKGVAGRLHGAKDEKPKPKEDAKPGKVKRSTGREVESEKVAPKDQQQQQQPEGRGKLQKAFTVASPEDIKPAGAKSPSLKRYASRKKVA